MSEGLKSRFAQPFLSRFAIFCAYTRPRYQVYRTRSSGFKARLFFFYNFLTPTLWMEAVGPRLWVSLLSLNTSGNCELYGGLDV